VGAAIATAIAVSLVIEARIKELPVYQLNVSVASAAARTTGSL